MTRATATDVHADVVVPLPAVDARDRLSALLHSAGDADPAAPLRLSVGPVGSGHFPSKQVDAATTGPRQLSSSYVYALRWEPVGIGAAAYPALEAKLAVTPVDATRSLLSILACYTPPFGAVGAAADRFAMSRVATATVRSVLRRFARELEHEPASTGGAP